MRTVNTDANTGWIIEPSFTRLSCFATAATARIGKQTAVMVSPTIAGTVLLPACAPRSGGKIRLPAPKNMENSMKPIVIVCRNPSFFIMCLPLINRQHLVLSEIKIMSIIPLCHVRNQYKYFYNRRECTEAHSLLYYSLIVSEMKSRNGLRPVADADDGLCKIRYHQ